MRDAFTVTPVLHKVNASKYQRCAASRKHFTVGSFAESLYCIGSKLQTNEPKSTHTLFFWSLVPLMKHQRSENKITMVFFLAPPWQPLPPLCIRSYPHIRSKLTPALSLIIWSIDHSENDQTAFNPKNSSCKMSVLISLRDTNLGQPKMIEII